MRHLNSIMSVLLAAPLALAGCPGDDGDEGANDSTTTNTPGTTTDEPGTTTDAVDSSSGDPTTDPTEGCSDPQAIPPAPVDCSGADGVIMTSVILEDGDDPSILEGVRRVQGSIILNRTSLTNLDFMACVEEVTGEINIFDNDSLTNVDGLWSLRELGTDFKFSKNDALVEFDGVPNLGRIIASLIIKENGALERITGFHSLVGLEGTTTTNDMGMEVFTGGNLTIQQNPSLVNMDGLMQLRVVNGVLAITNNVTLCVSSIACVGDGIVQPAVPPGSWSIAGNKPGC